MRCADDFREVSDHYLTTLTENFRNFRGANKKSGPKQDVSVESRTLDPSLYKPQFFLPLGHSDLQSLMLVDDFDPVHYITAMMRTTLEGMSVGFIPQAASIGVGLEDQFYGDLREICARKETELAGAVPLMVFSKIKIDGLASIGLGVSFQHGIWRAMIRRLRKLFAAMCKGVDPDFDITPEDIKTTQCVILDLQGCEEIGFLIFTRNLSVAMAIVSGLRAMTYEDVFTEDPALASLLNRSRVHASLLKFAGTQSNIPFAGKTLNSGALHSNHLFKWTHSTVSIRPSKVVQPGSERLFPAPEHMRGYVWAASRLQIAPGHFAQTDILEGPDARTRADPANYKLFRSPPRQFCLGLYDRIYQHKHGGFSNFYMGAVPAGRVVDNIEKTLRILCERTTALAEEPRRRDVVDFETEIVVPVPDLRDDADSPLVYVGVPAGHNAPLLAALRPLVDHLCNRAAQDGKGQEESGGSGVPGSLDIEQLMDSLRGYGIPVSLRRTIEYLFRNFSIVTADPFTFDTFLDLYDTFATLHALFTTHFAELNLGSFAGSGGSPRQLLDGERVELIADFANALQNAMSHRSANAFRDPAWRDMSVHLRGGLNQILQAADVPLKCGLGVLRRFATDDIPADGWPRNTVACVMQIGSIPGAQCKKIWLGTEVRCRLAYFNIDVPHILHPASYADMLHEAFHLVFDEVAEHDSEVAEAINACEIYDRERLEEIFTLALSRLFIFGDDAETFLYHSVLSYSRSCMSVGLSNSDTVVKFNEFLLRLFVTTDTTPVGHGDPGFWPPAYPVEIDASAASARFELMVKRIGPFFSEYERLWQGPLAEDVWSTTRQHFEIIYPRLMRVAPQVWEGALRVYQRAIKTVLPFKNPEQLASLNEEMAKTIRASFEAGQPLVWSDLRAGLPPAASGRINKMGYNLEGADFDPLILVCRLLYHYIEKIDEAARPKMKKVHLRRTAIGAKVNFDDGADWWEFLADKGAAGLFSCVPVAREARLLRQIVVLKSLWGLSSELKARRLLEMLEKTASD